MVETLYTKLEVPQDATTAEIKKAYRKLALRYHPDQNPNDAQASQKFQDIQKVYEILSNPTARAEYDALLGLPPRSTKASSSRKFTRDNQWEQAPIKREDDDAFRNRWKSKWWRKISMRQTLGKMQEGTDNWFQFYYLLGFILWIGYKLLHALIHLFIK